jgi:hypothetical protein
MIATPAGVDGEPGFPQIPVKIMIVARRVRGTAVR